MCKSLGDGEELPPSMGDVMLLLTGDALFGKASDKEAGLAIFFMSYIGPVMSLIKNVLTGRTKKYQSR